MKEIELTTKKQDMIVGNKKRTVFVIDSKSKSRSPVPKKGITRKSHVNKNCNGCSRKKMGSNRRG